jgi:DNA-binding transcriptional regulator of glucitol operon
MVAAPVGALYGSCVRRRWFSGKALLLHLALVAAASLCLLAGWWQVNRAMSGNLLSYGYAIEWPVFAVIAGFFWWQLIHEHPKDAALQRSQPRSAPLGAGTSHKPERRREEESPQLQAYNDDLSALAARGRPKTWRNPKGLP